MSYALPTHASRTAAMTAQERQPVDVLELTLDKCTLIHGVGACTASTANGTAQAGAASTITLAAGASAVTDFYKYMEVYIVSGTGSGQSRQITAYNGTTKVATVETAWTTNPDATSVYRISNRPLACFNTYNTCQAKSAYIKGTQTLKFVNRGAPIPPGEGLRPYIVSVSSAPTLIDIEQGLSRRAVAKIVLSDETDSDTETDPYLDRRLLAGTASGGSFWPKLLRRSPNYSGRSAKLRRGFAVSPWDWNTFLDELYVIDAIDGPDSSGRVEITIKDPLKLTDRVRLPAATDGKLLNALKATEDAGIVVSATSTTVKLRTEASAVDEIYTGMEIYITSNAGAGQRRTITAYVGATRTATVAAWAVLPASNSAYEVGALKLTLNSGKGAQYADPATSGKREFVRIGAEIIEYTAKSGDVLSWPSTAYRAQFGSTRKDASSNAGVQQCRAFIGQRVKDVIEALLNESGIVDANIDLTQLAAEDDTWLRETCLVTACLSAPEQVSTLLGELMRQCNMIGWWSPQTQKVEFRILLPLLETPQIWTDEANFIEESTEVEVLNDLRLTRYAVSYDQIDATSNMKEPKNFNSTEMFIDVPAESAFENNDQRADVIFSRWFNSANALAMKSLAARVLSARRDAPRSLSFNLDPKDYTLAPGELVDVKTRRLTDAYGNQEQTRCIIIKSEDRGSHVEIEARTTNYYGKRWAFIAPAGYPDFSAASDAQKKYAFIASSSGTMSDGSDAYRVI